MELSCILNRRVVIAPKDDPKRYFGWVERVESERIMIRLTTGGSLESGVPIAIAVSLPNALASFAGFLINQEGNCIWLSGPYGMSVRMRLNSAREAARVRHEREIQISRNGLPSVVRVRDISASGIGVETLEEMASGEPIEATLKIDDSEVVLDCTVRSCRALGDSGKFRVGLQITGGDRVSKGRWNVLLREAAQIEVTGVDELTFIGMADSEDQAA